MWYEIKIKTNSESVDIINDILCDYNAYGIVIEDPNDPIYSEDYEGDWDYFEVDMCAFEYEGALIKAYIEFGRDKDRPDVDYSTMSSQITALDGNDSADLMVEEYGDMDNLITSIYSRIAVIKEFGLDLAAGIDLGEPEITYSEVKNEDYVNTWRENYHAFEITEDIVICPSWEADEKFEGKKVIYLDPGSAFGTGTHETTSMCAEFINKYYQISISEKSKSTNSESALNNTLLYDIGCGSGILAMVGAVLGIDEIVGIDIDERAVEVSIENAKINELDNKITFIQGNLVEKLTRKADIIVANIIADVIIGMAADIKTLMLDNSVFIASGIINEKSKEVQTALINNGFKILEAKSAGEWSAIVASL